MFVQTKLFHQPILFSFFFKASWNVEASWNKLHLFSCHNYSNSVLIIPDPFETMFLCQELIQTLQIQSISGKHPSNIYNNFIVKKQDKTLYNIF